MWIIIAAGIAVVVILAVARRRATADESDLGWVTERWLAEYRADQAADPK